jgi:hydrogenase expression/formation protein HypE
MKQKEQNILLSHGSGGQMMHELIDELFTKHFGNEILNKQTDSAILPAPNCEIAFTTDSYVIDPIFFPGGDIGKLAVCGTVNDLSVSGAVPLYISVSFILEEGFPVADLERIVKSLADEAKKAGVLIVTGDTKVVNRGKCDKLFINTAGIGRMRKNGINTSNAGSISEGDVIIINGTIADHGLAVMNARESFSFRTNLVSDCASLNDLISEILDKTKVKFMRDPTRGGVATVLNEIAGKTELGIEIDEQTLPANPGVKAMCELLGFDLLHIANEGKVIIVASAEESDRVIDILKNNTLGKECSVIGRVVADHPGKVVIKSFTGGRRIVDTLSGSQLPRIC